MSYKCKINNKETNIRDGFTINDEFNEKLDGGTIQFITESGEHEIEAFDGVVLTNQNGINISRKKLLVDTFDSEIEHFTDNLETSSYSYIANLMSETKELERITCPKLSIRKRPDGSIVSVWNKVKEYCLMYLPRIIVYENSSNRKVLKCAYKYDKALETKLSMECPEMSFNETTLREILGALFSVGNCLPVIKENVLTFIDLDFRGSEIDQSKLTNKKQSQTSADYCDELTIPMKNVITKKSTKVEWVCPRTTESAELTTNNMMLITQKPIYKIKSLIVYAPSDRAGLAIVPEALHHTDLINAGFTDGQGNRYYYDFIVEEDEFKILNPRTKNIGMSIGDLPANYQFSHLKYKRGSNIISGLGETISVRVGGAIPTEMSRLSWAFACADAMTHDQYIGFTDLHRYQIWGTDQRNIIFRIEYETVDETTLHVGKLTQIRHPNNKLFDNQSSQSVDLFKQTISEYLKVNRLGSKIMTIFGEYTSESEVPALGDTIGEKVLFSRSLTYYDNQIMFMGQMVDNYILCDYYTGVLSKRRSLAIVDASESVVRHDVAKFYITASFNYCNYSGQQNVPFIYNHYSNEHYVDVFSGVSVGNNYLIREIATHISGKNGSIYADNNRVIMDSAIHVAGRSVICDFGFIDNAVAGYTVFYTGDDPEYENILIPACDANGEFNNIKIYLCNEIRPLEEAIYGSIESNLSALEDPDYWNSDEGAETFDLVTNYTQKRPYTITRAYNTKEYIELNSNYLKKDNGEAIKITAQFEFTSDDPKIIVTDYLAEHSNYVYSGFLFLKVYTLRDDKFRQNETKARGITRENYEVELINHANYQELHLISPTGLEENDAWCVADELNGNILIAVNGNEDRVIFQLREIRDMNVYNSNVDKIAIGKAYEDSELDAKYQQNLPNIQMIQVAGHSVSATNFKDFEENDEN